MHPNRTSISSAFFTHWILLLAFATGASALLIGAPVQAEPLTKDQQKCAGSLTRNWNKVNGAAAKQIAGCLKNHAKGKALSKSDPAVVTVEQCIAGDEKGKIQSAKDKTVEDFARFCTGNDKNGDARLPPYAVTDAVTVNADAVAHGSDLAHAVFGSDLDSGVLIPEATSKAAAKCQLGIWKAAGKCDATRFKEFGTCKKLALKGGAVTSGQGLQDTCLGTGEDGQPDPKGKIAKACTGPDGGIGKAVAKCDDGLALESLLPECGAENPTQCLQNEIATQGCSAINATDDLSRDCNPGPSGATCEDDNRVIFYVPNWEACPSTEQLSRYTHAMIGFGVTYTWTAEGNICNTDCELQEMPVCSGLTPQQAIDRIHSAGLKAILSFGGAGMGGIWDGEGTTTCWDYCLDKASELADQLVARTQELGYDGVDIDYESFLNHPNQVAFVVDLTNELRDGLDEAFPNDHKLVTHAPMDVQLDILGTCPAAVGYGDDSYVQVLEATTGAVDFIMPQFYNGCFNPHVPAQTEQFLESYGAIVDQIYGGDASRVAVGFCSEDCASTGSNATPTEVVDVLQQVYDEYPTNGGMMLWESGSDTSGEYGIPLSGWRAGICPAP